MARRETYEQRAEEILLPILSGHNFELVDVEYIKEAGEWYLRAYIDKEGGITIDDCEIVSRTFSDRLDEADFIEDGYILEVSSPGLTRPLKKEKDYVRNIGKLIEVKVYKPVQGYKGFEGILKAFDKDTVTLELEEDCLVVERSNISMIRQAFVE